MDVADGVGQPAVCCSDPNKLSVPRDVLLTWAVHTAPIEPRAPVMIERRAEPRTYLTDVTGRILIDEHRTVPCIISDRSAGGVRVTLPSTEDVPDAFVLTVDSTGETLICRAAWRKPDQIGCTADAHVSVGIPRSLLRRQLAMA